jgi:hypothetical protein
VGWLQVDYLHSEYFDWKKVTLNYSRFVKKPAAAGTGDYAHNLDAAETSIFVLWDWKLSLKSRWDCSCSLFD